MIRRPPRSTLFPYTTLFRSTSGNPPTAAQMLGYDILDFAQLGVVADLNELAGQEKWDEVVPAALQNFSKRSEEHTSELQSRQYLVCRLLLENKINVSVRRTG